MSDADLAIYNPNIPRPLMQVHGVNDAIVPYAGTPLPSLSLVNPTIDKLKTVNGWNGDSTITNIPNTANDNTTIEKIVYDCDTRLEHWKMSGTGAGHIFLFEPQNDTSGMEITWHFLRENSHPNPTLSNHHFELEQTAIQIYPNPASTTFNITNPQNIKAISIYNTNQQLVMETSKTTHIDISNLSNGLYLVCFKDKRGGIHTELLNKQ